MAIIDDFIGEAARLMEEQARDYSRLEAACSRLCEVLIQGDVSAIESTTRSSEVTLLQMRARLVRIIRALTAFSDVRAKAQEGAPSLSPEARSEFESASSSLLRSAENFQRTRKRAAVLTTSGATFAMAFIEACGIKPTTYNGPYARGREARPWA